LINIVFVRLKQKQALLGSNLSGISLMTDEKVTKVRSSAPGLLQLF